MGKIGYATIEADSDGNLYIPFSEELMKDLSWQSETILIWEENEDGTYTIRAKE